LINCAFLYEKMVASYSGSKAQQATNSTEEPPTETTALLMPQEKEDAKSEELREMELYLRVSLIRVSENGGAHG
jgi:hypothetical protein